MEQVFDKINTDNANIIGLYFSGEYCKYCKEFTPILVDAYPSLLNNKIDIVYISSDKSIEQYNQYRGTQPWQSLPYEETDLRNLLRTEFDIKTIPALLFFDVKQKLLIEPNGRNLIRDDCDNAIKKLITMTIAEYDSDDNDF